MAAGTKQKEPRYTSRDVNGSLVYDGDRISRNDSPLVENGFMYIPMSLINHPSVNIYRNSRTGQVTFKSFIFQSESGYVITAPLQGDRFYGSRYSTSRSFQEITEVPVVDIEYIMKVKRK